MAGKRYGIRGVLLVLLVSGMMWVEIPAEPPDQIEDDPGEGGVGGGRCPLPRGCCPSTCGNGILECAETCDDGNVEAGDDCSPTCRWERPDHRMEWFEADSQLLRFAEADAIVVPTENITPDGPDTLAVDTSPWTVYRGVPVCANVPFWNQQVVGDGTAGASAVLVGNDLVLSAGHAISNQQICEDRAFVFDFRQSSAETPPLGNVDAVIVPSENVYDCAELVATGSDWSLVRLDRSVDDIRRPLKPRRGLKAIAGDRVAVLGHPSRLTMKIESPVLVLETPNHPEAVLVVGTHLPRLGISGSMVANLATGRLEGIVLSGVEGLTEDPTLGCLTERNPGWGFATVNSAQAAPIPSVGLEIETSAKGDLMEHAGPIGGPFPSLTWNFMVASGSRTVICDARLEPICPSCPLPFELVGAPCDSTIEPGDSATLTVRPTFAANFLPPGDYDALLIVEDHAYATVETITHRLRIGSPIGLPPTTVD